MITTDNGNTLKIIPKRKSWGPNYLTFGLGWESDLSLGSNLGFDMAYTKTNINDYDNDR